MSTTPDRVGEFVAPLAAELGLRAVRHRVLRWDPACAPRYRSSGTAQDHGVDVDRLTEATRRISRWLDEREEAGEPVTSGPYALEVSSPGLERHVAHARALRRRGGGRASGSS